MDVILVAFLVQGLIWGAAAAWIADQKGRDPVAWFLVGAVLSLLGLLIVGFAPAVSQPGPPVAEPPPALLATRRGRAAVAERPTKQCPDCAEQVLAEARICRFCRHEFDPTTIPAIPAPPEPPWHASDEPAPRPEPVSLGRWSIVRGRPNLPSGTVVSLVHEGSSLLISSGTFTLTLGLRAGTLVEARSGRLRVRTPYDDVELEPGGGQSPDAVAARWATASSD